MTERLTEDYYDEMQDITRHYAKSNNIDLNTGGEDFQDIIDKLAEYEAAEEEGILVVLPCKVGDFVYKIIYQRDNFDDRPYRIVTKVRFRFDMIDDIGKTIFLTREEAEKKLEEIKHEI